MRAPAKGPSVTMVAAAMQAAGGIVATSYRGQNDATAKRIVGLTFAILDEYAAEEARREEAADKVSVAFMRGTRSLGRGEGEPEGNATG